MKERHLDVDSLTGSKRKCGTNSPVEQQLAQNFDQSHVDSNNRADPGFYRFPQPIMISRHLVVIENPATRYDSEAELGAVMIEEAETRRIDQLAYAE